MGSGRVRPEIGRRGVVCGVVFGLILMAGFAMPRALAVDATCAFSDRYPVEVAVLGSEGARAVVDTRIDVDEVRLPEGPFMPGLVRAYVNDRERSALETAGFEVRPIPNEANEAFVEVQRQRQAREELARAGQPIPQTLTTWPTYSEYQAELQAVADAHPDITRLTSLGNSVQGRPIWILRISDNASIEEKEPEFKFTSTIHGDEVTGMELCRRMIHYLVDNYGSDPRVTNLVNSAELWFCPLHNPDGYVNHTRYNAHGVDLNRTFPDPITDPHDDPSGREPEVQHFMYFGYDHNFILSANYHGGALVMNIPWDCQYPHIPDYDLTWSIASGYSYRNPPMWNGSGGIGIHGVVVGAEWYVIHGGMQDWCYNWRSEIDITIEVSQTKWPGYGEMDTYWNNNRESMLYYMEQTLSGVKGTVTDAVTGLPVSASVNVLEFNKPILSDPDLGDYHRMLLPGAYTFKFEKIGYVARTVPNVVVSGMTPTMLDVALLPAGVAAPDIPLRPGSELAGSEGFALSAPAPNPMNPATGPVRMILALPGAGVVSAGVFDASGRQIRTLLNGATMLRAGAHELAWDGRTERGTDAGAGVYWIRASWAGKWIGQRVSVLR